MSEVKELVKDIAGVMSYLGENTPEQMEKFKGLLGSASKEGALSEKTKELIFVALAVHARCDKCIAYHVKKAVEAGLGKEEILEASWVAVAMGGGPALAYMSLVQKALDEFKN
ncbi:MAG: carboxymuconolactone decarboxylase family protein [Candidatus Aenigmarchaeota archaeon]|nr:carboxymuconolactone decarboxylase family protein [Candidatus Aenigmarchaeota archaeon]